MTTKQLSTIIVVAVILSEARPPIPPKLEPIRVAKDGHSFVLEPSGKTFTPWGFNYDHDAKGRLIEDYWDEEWDKVERPLRPDEGDSAPTSSASIFSSASSWMPPTSRTKKRWTGSAICSKLAERNGLYLDLTGLGCYHKDDVPAWYDKLAEKDRWAAQARFWEAVAGRVQEARPSSATT